MTLLVGAERQFCECPVSNILLVLQQNGKDLGSRASMRGAAGLHLNLSVCRKPSSSTLKDLPFWSHFMKQLHGCQ